jgi:hypothetical protein
VGDDELEEEGEALREPVDFGGGAGRGADAQRARQLEAVSWAGWGASVSRTAGWQGAGRAWVEVQGGRLAVGPPLQAGWGTHLDSVQLLPRIQLFKPMVLLHPPPPPPFKVLDDYGLLRSRHRSYISRSGRVRGGRTPRLPGTHPPPPAGQLVLVPALSHLLPLLPPPPSTVQRHGSAAAAPAAAPPATQHPLLARPPSAGGHAASAAAALAGGSAPARYEAVYRAAIAQASRGPAPAPAAPHPLALRVVPTALCRRGGCLGPSLPALALQPACLRGHSSTRCRPSCLPQGWDPSEASIVQQAMGLAFNPVPTMGAGGGTYSRLVGGANAGTRALRMLRPWGAAAMLVGPTGGGGLGRSVEILRACLVAAARCAAVTAAVEPLRRPAGPRCGRPRRPLERRRRRRHHHL